MSDIYINIKKLIKQKKYITQQEVADKIGVSTNTFSSWMNKKVGIKAEQVPKLASILRVSILDLYGKDADTVVPEERVVVEKGNEGDKAVINLLKEQLAEERQENKKLEREITLLKTRKTAPVRVTEDGGEN